MHRAAMVAVRAWAAMTATAAHHQTEMAVVLLQIEVTAIRQAETVAIPLTAAQTAMSSEEVLLQLTAMGRRVLRQTRVIPTAEITRMVLHQARVVPTITTVLPPQPVIP